MKPKQDAAKSAKKPPEKKPISETECLFTKDRVPNAELPACLGWEFLRESKTVQNLAAEWAEWSALGAKAPDQNSLWAKMKDVKLAINYPFRWAEFTASTIVQAFGILRLLDKPWQSLNQAGREKFIGNNTANPPAFIGYDLQLSLLNEALREKTSATGLVKAIAMLDKIYPGKQAVLMILDWGRYDDAPVRDEAHKIIDRLPRPAGLVPEIRHGSGLGRADEWRGKLSDLGLARLSARYHARQLLTELPHIYEFVAQALSDKGTTAVEKKLRDARRRFEASFHKILPFEKNPPRCLAESRFAK